MKKIKKTKIKTLDSIIVKQIKKDPEFAQYYQRELLINEISRLVVNVRKAARLTQTQLAEKASTTQPVIARLESGLDKRIPSLELLARIATATHAKLHIKFEYDRE